MTMKNKRAVGWIELILGILLIILAIYSFISPATALTGFTLLYGILALITGVVDIVFYVQLERHTGFGPVLSLVSGILSILAGILIVFNLSAGTWVLVILFPIWFIAHCISRLTHLPFICNQFLMPSVGLMQEAAIITLPSFLISWV